MLMITRPPSPAMASEYSCVTGSAQLQQLALAPCAFLSPLFVLSLNLPIHPCLVITPRTGRRCTFSPPACPCTPLTPPPHTSGWMARAWPRRTWPVRDGRGGGGGAAPPCSWHAVHCLTCHNASARPWKSSPSSAGAAALLWSYSPALTLAEVRANLLSSVDAVPAFSTLCTSGVSGAPQGLDRTAPCDLGAWEPALAPALAPTAPPVPPTCASHLCLRRGA
jgi:hypothetical protein